ncbi:MAG: hypothetical protein JNK04_13855 [Myxococcales bacterium]|nr:hypothetical protein [Myxococcales bacterium]
MARAGVIFRFLGIAAMLSAFAPATSALACPDRGGGEAAVSVDDQITELLVAARKADQTAMREEQKARSAKAMAEQQRELAASLRERARNFPELDADILRAKAVVADREANAADARARTATGTAKLQRSRAAKLRALAKQLSGGDMGHGRNRLI